ncbi:MAG TPA: LamG-like jellyroll fold domain-containing protein [Streptosporangiaceae bacterium]|nr:LamG-like jellyroll fold domain-containing protein [Streptosporangiaceae bacterium]
MTVSVVNQWGGTFARSQVFGSCPPALPDVAVALSVANKIGSGTGIPSAGNWLLVIAGIRQQQGIPAVTCGITDDIDSWYRAAPPSPASGTTTATRTKIEYTANLARIPQYVYVSPSGPVDGLAVLVFEVAGLGPWDLVTVTPYSAYAAAATSLGLSLAAPSQSSLVIAAACGDSTAAGQAFAPGGWTTLATVTGQDGTDHLADTVLTSAWTVTSGSVSVNATASSAENLSGYITALAVTAASPIPGGTNPAWPYLIYEAGLGSGFETPPDQVSWTTLTKRLLSWHETGGIQYELGQLRSTTVDLNLRNWDGALSPGNTSGPYYPNLAVGTPIRIRAAVGGTVNRWYVISRNALTWPEKRSPRTLLGYVPAQGTDIWSVTQAPSPSPYRGEVYQDLAPAKGWWWPCDDQPLAGGVQPASLRNAAPGNTQALSIAASANGVGLQDCYGGVASATDLSALFPNFPNTPVPAIATYMVAQDAGWMYGDPQSSGASSAAEGGPVTASPGSAAWAQTGVLGNTGAHAWYLACNDATFPDAGSATGCTVEGWFSVPFFRTAAAFTGPTGSGQYGGNIYNEDNQPACPITLISLATASSPVATLQLDNSGHLTFSLNGGSASTIYNSSDLRCGSWFHVAFSISSSGWTVYLNGGITATGSSASVPGPSAFTWLTACGDFASGGGTPSGIQHSGSMSVSHLAVYPRVLPAHRILAHYTAATTGFGVIPAPSGLALSQIGNKSAGSGFTADGSTFSGSYGWVNSTTLSNFVFSCVLAAVIGSYTSGPSARQTIAGRGVQANPKTGQAVWAQWTALAPLVQAYTAASANAETEAGSFLGSGGAFLGSGYGSGSTNAGVCSVGAGTGASPPSGPSAIGDTVQWRILRLLYYIGVTFPLRSIDPASLLVQAANDIGGKQGSQSVDAIRQSDSGLLSVGNSGALRYRMRGHLAADTAAWQLSSNAAANTIPFLADQSWETDPQRVYDIIRIHPYSPDGANLPDLTPGNWSSVQASQAQYGPRPLDVTSYLQSATEQQAQADWLLAQYGVQRRRCAVITVDAAPLARASYPQAWPFVLGVSIGDLVQITDQPPGQGVTVGTYRVTNFTRDISNGADGSPVTGKVQCICDYEPTSYWT